MSGRIPAGALQGGDIAVLPLPGGDEICQIRRVIHPGASQVVLIDFRLADGTAGTFSLLITDAVVRVQENLARAAA